MMVMFKKLGKNELQTELDNDKGDDETDVSFDIYMPDEINQGGKQHSATNDAVIDGFYAASNEGVGANFFTGVFEIAAEEKFTNNASDKDDDNWGRVFDFFWGDEFFDRFDDDVDANGENNNSNSYCTNVLDFFVAFVKFFTRTKFFTNDNDNAGKGVY